MMCARNTLDWSQSNIFCLFYRFICTQLKDTQVFREPLTSLCYTVGLASDLSSSGCGLNSCSDHY